MEDKQENARWENALTILRKNEDGLSEPFKKVPRVHPHEYEVGIRIERLEKKKESSLKPQNNVLDSLSKVA